MVKPLIKRNIVPHLREALSSFRVVVLQGPRQSGKTTVARQMAEPGAFLALDDPQDRQLASDNPVETLTAASPPMVVDEVQLGGDALVRAIKVIVDENREPGQFLITGSANFLTVPTISESLAGRAVLLNLHPLSQGELAGRREVFLEGLVGNPEGPPPGEDSRLSVADYWERVCAGGYPEAVDMPSPKRKKWFTSLVSTVTLRDVIDLTGARRASSLSRLLRLAAAGTAQELVMSKIHDRLGFGNVRTTAGYLSHLEMAYLTHQLAPWSRNLASRVTRRPKLYVTDTGLAASLINVTVDSLVAPSHPARGPLLETFVVNEIIKQSSWLDWSLGPIEIFHYRDRHGLEVDLIMELPDSRIIAIEVKAATTVTSNDWNNLKKLRKMIGDQFAQGIVFYTGSRSRSAGDQIYIRPIESLWQP